ncbi:helix-turn-helix domain-containing protein [Leptolyngbya sp. GB1-A1]
MVYMSQPKDLFRLPVQPVGAKSQMASDSAAVRLKQATQARSRSVPETMLPTADRQSQKSARSGNDRPTDRLHLNPDLFAHGSSTRMASALPIWEASNILTQRGHLPWQNDPDGKLHYAKDIDNGQGAIHFWVTEDLENDYPVSLAGAAALAVVDTFDIRAACMHLIYAACATQFAKPWEQELVIDDRQIESYLGLKKRTDLNRQQKLALIEEIAKQPCKITTFISYPNQGKVKGFTLEEGRLWHLLGTRYHYQHDLLSNKELVGITFVIRAGLWAKYFLNEEGRRKQIAHYQHGILSKTLLESIMSLWQHREGAARLMVWLLFKTQFDRRHPLTVQTLMEVAYGQEKVQQARLNSEARKRLSANWDEDLLTLHERGWKLQFDPESYPIEIQPPAFGRMTARKPRGFFDKLLAARLWITAEAGMIDQITPPEDENTNAALQIEEISNPVELSGSQVKDLRIKKGWSQRKLASMTGISQGLISLIENGERNITPENAAILQQVLS